MTEFDLEMLRRELWRYVDGMVNETSEFMRGYFLGRLSAFQCSCPDPDLRGIATATFWDAPC